MVTSEEKQLVANINVREYRDIQQMTQERLMEQGQALHEQERRDHIARFELMVERLDIHTVGREMRVKTILTDVLCDPSNGDMARMILRAMLSGNETQINGLSAAWMAQAAEIYANREMS